MPKITDPDSLNVGTEITFTLASKTFTLGAAGNLVAKDGVTGNALWAKFVDLWTDPTYQPYPFPMNLLDARSGQYVFGQDPDGAYNGWKPADDTTRQMIRDAGWSEYSGAGVLNRQYVGGVALASGFPAGAQFYYQRISGGSPLNFTFTDAPNEALQVFGDATNGSFDNRAFLKMFCREPNYTYDDAVLADVGETGTGPYKVSLPVSVGSDLNITDNDATVAASLPYTAIKARFFPTSYQRDVDLVGTPRDFGIVIDVGTHSGVDGVVTNGGSTLTSAEGAIVGADYIGGTLTVREGAAKGVYTISGTPTATVVTITGGTFPAAGTALSYTLQRAAPVSASAKQIYTKAQYLLRQATNINSVAGSVIGKTAALLLKFAANLEAGRESANPNGGGAGVFIEGIAAADVNSIDFYDNSSVKRVFPFSAAGVLNFNSFLSAGGTGYYRMYFTTLPGANNDYGEASAVTVNNSSAAPITGVITSGTISFTFDYDANVQGGRTPGADAAVTIIAGNPGSAKPVKVTGLITRSKAVAISLSASQDLGYIA